MAMESTMTLSCDIKQWASRHRRHRLRYRRRHRRSRDLLSKRKCWSCNFSNPAVPRFMPTNEKWLNHADKIPLLGGSNGRNLVQDQSAKRELIAMRSSATAAFVNSEWTFAGFQPFEKLRQKKFRTASKTFFRDDHGEGGTSMHIPLELQIDRFEMWSPWLSSRGGMVMACDGERPLAYLVTYLETLTVHSGKPYEQAHPIRIEIQPR
ncbi:hypothetical protein [Absidia glauca]|uniref:Uncharacterized protein n=1 Tax=Absidia glauca TaxID=4829 RepID=A0A163JTT4_ABSGL|nr:hypothetical protein [Absidia glauca]